MAKRGCVRRLRVRRSGRRIFAAQVRTVPHLARDHSFATRSHIRPCPPVASAKKDSPVTRGQSAEPTGDRRACYRPDLVPVGAAGLRGVIARCALAQGRALSPHGRFKPICISRCGQAGALPPRAPAQAAFASARGSCGDGATPASWYPTSRLRTPRRSARACSPPWLCYVLDASGRRGPNAAVASAPARARTRDMRRGARRALRASAHTADRRAGGVLVT